MGEIERGQARPLVDEMEPQAEEDVRKMFGELFEELEDIRNDVNDIKSNFDLSLADPGDAERRQMQGVEPAIGKFVLQIKRNVTRVTCPLDADAASGHFDKSRCGDPAWERCHRKECIGYNGDHSHPGDDGKGHRRAQTVLHA